MMVKVNKFKGSFVMFMLPFFSFYACRNVDESGQEPPKDYTFKGDTLVLNDGAGIASKLTLGTVTSQDFITEFTTVGTVRSIPNAYAEIAPPFAGRVLKSHVKLGQKVRIGDPIFEISSSGYFEAQKAYFDAKQEFHQVELKLKRQQDLMKNGLGAQRELEETETEFNLKKMALSNTLLALRIFTATPETAILGQPLIVRSPLSGNIISNNLVIGQYLKEDASPLVVVAELSKVWVVAQIKEKDIALVHQLDEVKVNLGAFPNKVIKGSIYHVNDIINENTRSVEVLVTCENPNHDLKPGMYANLTFKNTPQRTLLIPTQAVFQKEDQQFVFVKTGAERFVKRKIETGTGANGNIAVTSGLTAGEIIVIGGGALMLRNY